MFGLTRSIIGSVLAVAGAYAVKKSKITKKRKWVFLMSLSIVVLVFISCMFPIENTLITFESSEKAFRYYYPSGVRLVVNGNETDFVVGQSNDYLILPKSEKGWKTSTNQELELLCSKPLDKAIFANVYKHKKYEDLYIVIYSSQGNLNEIRDNAVSEFYSLKNPTAEKYCSYFAYINSNDKPYYITINGKDILIGDFSKS